MSQNLSFGSGLGVVFLTTVIGGFAGFGLSFFLIPLLKITNFEGGAGYFTLSVTLLGIAGGFIVGLISALTLTSGFEAALTRAASIVVALAVVTGIAATLSVVFEDKGPHLDGENIRLEVEFKCPQGWKPPDASLNEHAGCLLQKFPGSLAENPVVSGKLTWTNPPAPGEPWAVSCAVPLEITTPQRYLVIYSNEDQEVTMEIPLPRHPGPQFQQWSAWSTKGFLPQKRSPIQPDGFAFRFRVRKESEYSASNAEAR